MNDKVKRTLVLLAVAAALFTISEMYTTTWMPWVRGASAGLALGGIVGVILIFAEALKGKR
jgi:high-affinity Fe2+/Pb2+ permease